MILREFGLRSSTPPPPRQLPLHDQARCVLALFERHLPRIETDGVRKVDIECVPSISKPGTRNLLGVLTLQVVDDAGDFYTLPDIDKKRRLLQILERGLDRVLQEHPWPSVPFSTAADRVRAFNFENARPFSPKWSGGRRHRAWLECRHEPSYFAGTLKVIRRSGELVLERGVFVEHPSEFIFGQRLGKLRWVDGEHVELLDRDGQRSSIHRVSAT